MTWNAQAAAIVTLATSRIPGIACRGFSTGIIGSSAGQGVAVAGKGFEKEIRRDQEHGGKPCEQPQAFFNECPDGRTPSTENIGKCKEAGTARDEAGQNKEKNSDI